MADNMVPANIAKTLAFDKRFESYESNLEKQSSLKKAINLAAADLNQFLRSYAGVSDKTGPYNPDYQIHGSNNDYSFNTNTKFPPVYIVKVYTKTKTNKIFESFRPYKSLIEGIYNSGLKDAFGKVEQISKFPEFVKDLYEYFSSIDTPTEDEEATKKLQDEYKEKLAVYESLVADLAEVEDKARNLERYIDTADKVARIARRDLKVK